MPSIIRDSWEGFTTGIQQKDTLQWESRSNPVALHTWLFVLVLPFLYGMCDNRLLTQIPLPLLTLISKSHILSVEYINICKLAFTRS